jgi:uncharacterized protein YndB with AHSA1/START domain/sulfur carrier protein ThiS
MSSASSSSALEDETRMKPVLAALALFASVSLAGAAERSIDKSIVVPATLD